MPRYRKLHVKATESLDINDMPDDFTRLMWLLMPLGLCREGRGIDNSAWIKSRLFPLRIDVTLAMIDSAMAWYAERGMITRYAVDGRSFFCVPSFPKYQGDTSREAESNYPPPHAESDQGSRVDPEFIERESTLAVSVSACESRSESDLAQPSQKPTVGGIHPALVRFYEVTGRKVPNESWAHRIECAVGPDPPSIERWTQVINAWVGCGWARGNVKGMLDFYNRNEIPPGDRSNGRGKPKMPVKEVPQAEGWADDG